MIRFFNYLLLKKLKTLFTIALLFFCLIATAQVAIIQDEDGYTNVREAPNGQAKIIHQIHENKVFWYDDNPDAAQEWIKVYIPKNNFSFDCASSELMNGFIHASRLKPLGALTRYDGANLTFEYKIQAFDSTNRIIDREDGEWAIAIDGRPVWGADGGLPKTEVVAIKASINGQPIEIHSVFFSDLYECDNTFRVYQNGDVYFVHQWNSDGAGAYELVWVLTEEGLRQRLVGTVL